MSRKCYSFQNPDQYILANDVRGNGAFYSLYSATGNNGTWHLDPGKAWADYKELVRSTAIALTTFNFLCLTLEELKKSLQYVVDMGVNPAVERFAFCGVVTWRVTNV